MTPLESLVVRGFVDIARFTRKRQEARAGSEGSGSVSLKQGGVCAVRKRVSKTLP